MVVRVQGTNLELTDANYDYVTEKLEDAFRAMGNLDRDPVKVDVELEETTRRHPQEREDERLYRAEANVSVPGRLIRAEGSADTLEQSIVEMKHRLTREIREWREQLIDERRRGARRAKRELGADGAVEGREEPESEEDRFLDELEDFVEEEEEGEGSSES